MTTELEDEHWTLIQEVKKEVQAFPGWRCAAVRIHPNSHPQYRFKAEAFSGCWRTEHAGEITDYQVRIEATRETLEAALRALPEILVEHIGIRAAASGFGVEAER